MNTKVSVHNCVQILVSGEDIMIVEKMNLYTEEETVRADCFCAYE